MCPSFRIGSVPALTPEVLMGNKTWPTPPPGLSPPADEGRTGLKGSDSRPLEKVCHCLKSSYTINPPWQINLWKLKWGTVFSPFPKILENEDPSGQSEDETSKVAAVSSSKVCDAVNNNNISRVGLMGRRGSLQGPDTAKVFGQGRRHSTGQALTYRSAFINLCVGIVLPYINSLRASCEPGTLILSNNQITS